MKNILKRLFRKEFSGDSNDSEIGSNEYKYTLDILSTDGTKLPGVSFKLNEKEKLLWDKYGSLESLEKLTIEKDYVKAEEIVDNVLKSKPRSEIALFLKAALIINKYKQESDIYCTKFERGSILKNIEILEKEGLFLIKQFKNAIRILEKVIEINPDTKNVKRLKSLIEKNSLNPLNNIIISINKTKEELEEAKRQDRRYLCKKCGYRWESRKRFGKPAICPYCRGDFIIEYSSTPEWLEEWDEL